MDALKMPTRALLTEFDQQHRQLLGVPAVIFGGKDAKLLAELCRVQGEAFVKLLMADFFSSRDPFIQQAGYSVGVFVKVAPKLIAARHRETKRIAALWNARNWRDECDVLHGGRCGSREFHAAVMAKEEE